MRVDASPVPVGHRHEAGFYDSDEDFRALITPFVEEGVDAGEPVIIGYDERKATLLRDWLKPSPAVTFMSDASLYSTPAGAIANYRRLFQRHVDAGAHQIRIAGDVPHEGNGGRFNGWDRYESAVNTVWEDFPVHSVCLYDASTVSADVRNVVERTHPHLLGATGDRRVNHLYEDSSTFVGLPATLDYLEASTPHVELLDATPIEARRAVRHVADGRLDENTLNDVVFATSEAVTNAVEHGAPPTLVRIWAETDRIIVHVNDSGPGPTDPLAGLTPTVGGVTGAGLGLWLTHQLDVDVSHMTTSDGFTIRLRAERAASHLGG